MTSVGYLFLSQQDLIDPKHYRLLPLIVINPQNLVVSLTYLNDRTWRYSLGTNLAAASLLAGFHSVRGHYAHYHGGR